MMASTTECFAHLPMYQYTALKDPSKHIRLLKVTKRRCEASFEAELTEVCLTDTLNNRGNEALRYTALSYTWGQPDDGRALIIDGVTLHIRSNIHKFFTFVHAETAQELFWIDAVCINQDDLEERGQQVKLMGQIYSQASKVRLWLGHGDETLCWLLRDICGIRSESGSLYITQMRELRDAEYRRNAQRGYPILSRLDYWTRLWIIQEVFLAREIMVHYDRECVSWDNLRQAWMVRQKVPAYGIQNFSSATQFNPLGVDTAMSNLIDVRENTEILEWRPMSLLLQQFDNSKCTQEHDRVYAILSLIENGDHFPVDYNCSFLELLVETLAFMVRTESRDTDRMPTFQELAEKLLIDLDFDNDDQIHVAHKSKLRRTRIPRSASPLPSSYQPRPNQPRHHILVSKFKTDSVYSWSALRCTSLFTPSQSDTEEEELEEMLGDNLVYIRHFLRSKTSDQDLIVLNKPLGILLILSPHLSVSPATQSENSQPPNPSQENSTYTIRGRISFNRSLRRRGFFGRAIKDRGFYELYTSAIGLPGAQVTIPRTGQDQDLETSQATLTLTITDARSVIILFGLPEHQGVRLAAIDLMTTCGGHPGFAEIEFWADMKMDGSSFVPGDWDVEVSIPSEGHGKVGFRSCIQYRPHVALLSQESAMAEAKSVKDNGRDDVDCYYYIDFLSEKDRIAACNALIEQ